MSNEYLNNKFLEGAIARFKNSKTEKAKLELILLQMRKFPDKVAKKAALGLTVEQCQSEYDRLAGEYSESQEMLTTAFYTLSENIVRYAKFNLIDIDDAIQEGVMICFEKLDRFDPTYKGKNGENAKAFNYMTTCILNHFRQLYRTARNYNELKKKYHDFLQAQNENQVPRRPKDKTSKGMSRLGNSD